MYASASLNLFTCANESRVYGKLYPPIPSQCQRIQDQIDKKTMEIKRSDDVVYKDMQELGDELPGHSPRFVLLSYPLTMVCLVALNYPSLVVGTQVDSCWMLTIL